MQRDTCLGETTLQLKLFNMNGNPDAGLPDFDNVLLATVDFDLNSTSYASDTWVQLVLDSTIPLVNGDLYGFLVFWDSDSAANTFDVRHSLDAGSTIAGGTMRTNTSDYNDAFWTGANPWANVQIATSDLTFTLGGRVIPEPSTVVSCALLLVGLLGFGIKARRRGLKQG